MHPYLLCAIINHQRGPRHPQVALADSSSVYPETPVCLSSLTSFAISKSSPHDDDDVDEMEDRDEAVEFDEDERFDVLFLAFMSSSMVP